MFEFIFELIDLFFTFYPKSIDINILSFQIYFEKLMIPAWGGITPVFESSSLLLHCFDLFPTQPLRLKLVIGFSWISGNISLLNPFDWNFWLVRIFFGYLANSTPSTEIGKPTKIWKRETLFVFVLMEHRLKTNKLVHICSKQKRNPRTIFKWFQMAGYWLIRGGRLTLRNLLRSLVGIKINSSWWWGCSLDLFEDWIYDGG